MTKGIVKRSVMIAGHSTSVSLEEPFWEEFRRLAAQDGLSVNELAATLDQGRGEAAGLASAIRVWVLERALASR